MFGNKINGEEQADACKHCEPESDQSSFGPLRLRQLADHDRNKDNIIDPENDLQARQGEQGDQVFDGEELNDVFHVFGVSCLVFRVSEH